MKVAAIGDAHLGRSYLPVHGRGRRQPARVGLREVLRGGRRRWPSNRSPTCSSGWATSSTTRRRTTVRSGWPREALAAIRDHGVPAVVISGNHDTPRLPGRGSPYSALADTFPEVHFAHRLAYERFEIATRDGALVVHAVPQMLSVDATLEALEEAGQVSQFRPHEPADHPSSDQASGAAPRRHKRDRDRPGHAPIGPRAARALPFPRRGGAEASGTPAQPTPSVSPTTPTRRRASSSSTPSAASAATYR